MKLPVATKRATVSSIKVKSCNALLYMLLVCVGSYLKSVLRYKFLIWCIYHPDTLFTPARNWESVVIFRSQRMWGSVVIFRSQRMWGSVVIFRSQRIWGSVVIFRSQRIWGSVVTFRSQRMWGSVVTLEVKGCGDPWLFFEVKRRSARKIVWGTLFVFGVCVCVCVLDCVACLVGICLS